MDREPFDSELPSAKWAGVLECEDLVINYIRSLSLRQAAAIALAAHFEWEGGVGLS